jgi:hypothetical protein
MARARMLTKTAPRCVTEAGHEACVYLGDHDRDAAFFRSAMPARKAPSQPLLQAKPHDAYGSQRRYADPDPNVQFEMMRQRNWRKG